jgi:hypothetical protein
MAVGSNPATPFITSLGLLFSMLWLCPFGVGSVYAYGNVFRDLTRERCMTFAQLFIHQLIPRINNKSNVNEVRGAARTKEGSVDN